MPVSKSTLYIAGFGIKTISHLTKECNELLLKSERVLYLLNEPLACEYIEKNANNTCDLSEIYFSESDRKSVYIKITDFILKELRKYKTVGVICYGHPFFCADSFLDAAQKAKSLGHNTIIFPGISSLDCMFADLMLDPTTNGFQCYEASQLIKSNHMIEPRANLIILQVGFINVKTHPHLSDSSGGFTQLSEYLSCKYPNDHYGYIYEASLYPSVKPRIEQFKLSELLQFKVTPISSIFIPALFD